MFLGLALSLLFVPEMLARLLMALPALQQLNRSSPLSGAAAKYAVTSVTLMAPTALLAGVVVERMSAELHGQRASLVGCLSTSFARVPALTAAMFLQTLGVVIGLFFFLVPGVLMGLAWAVVTPVVVVEGGSPPSCFQRSADLTRGVRGAVFGFSVAIRLVSLILAFAVGVAAGLVLLALRPALPSLPLAGRWLFGSLVSTAGAAISSVLVVTGEAALYQQLRREREGATPSVAAVFD